MWRQLYLEIFEETGSYTEQEEKIVNFLSVPLQLEKLVLFGYLICLDSLLFMFTILPIRFARAFLKFITTQNLSVSQKADIMMALLIVLASYALSFIDASKIYHIIRGQSMIKLYVIFNVLEICDKLLSAFGHNVLDSLFATATASPFKHRITRVYLFFLAFIYVFAHTNILFFQVMSLNVAVNSHNNALFTLLLSNQFVEIKSSVFKRFEQTNLFQLSCAGISCSYRYCGKVSALCFPCYYFDQKLH